MDGGLLQQGVELMIAGMATVFVFLTTLVVATQLMSLAVRRFAPVPAPEVSPVTAEELAAITAAIHQHRRQASAPRAES